MTPELQSLIDASPMILTIAQVAQILKVSPRHVSRLFDSGRLRGYRIPGSQDRRIPRDSLLRFLKENELPTEEETTPPAPWRVTATGLEQIEPPVSAPQPAPPTLRRNGMGPGSASPEPTPVAPTKPGLYPLADGTTVYLVGRDRDGHWAGLHDSYVRFWRETGVSCYPSVTPPIIGPRIVEPIDDEAAIARVNELLAAERLDLWHGELWHGRSTRFRLNHRILQAPPDDWPPEIQQAAIEAAKKHGLEVAK